MELWPGMGEIADRSRASIRELAQDAGHVVRIDNKAATKAQGTCRWMCTCGHSGSRPFKGDARDDALAHLRLAIGLQ